MLERFRAWVLNFFKTSKTAAKMTTISIEFTNRSDEPFYLQVDPWAGFYLLKKGDGIKIEADDESTSRWFDVDEHADRVRILQIDSADYYVVLDGKRTL